MPIPKKIEAPFSGKRVLVTGASGNLGAEFARALAAQNTVYGTGRFSNAEARGYLEAVGVTPMRHDLSSDSIDALPADIDYVFNFGAILGNYYWKGEGSAAADEFAKVNALVIGRMMRRWPRLAGFVQASTST